MPAPLLTPPAKPRARLTADDEVLIRQLWHTGETARAIAGRIGCSRSAVGNRALKHRWPRRRARTTGPDLTGRQVQFRCAGCLAVFPITWPAFAICPECGPGGEPQQGPDEGRATVFDRAQRQLFGDRPYTELTKDERARVIRRALMLIVNEGRES